METEGSDNEFWADIDGTAEQVSKPQTGVSFNNDFMSALTAKMSNPINVPKGDRSLKEYYEDKIDRIREAKDEEIKQQLIINTKQIQKQYQEAFKKLKTKNKAYIDLLKNEVFQLTEVLKQRDCSIEALIKQLSDSEALMIGARLEFKIRKKFLQPPLTEEFYLEQIFNLSVQLANLKEVCGLYLKEIEQLKDKNLASQEKQAKIEQSYKDEIKKLKGLQNKREAEFENQLKLFHSEFDKYKNEINLESQAKDILVDRQRNHIDVLKDELKNAKFVLQNRKIRSRLHEKLNDYIKDSDCKVRSEVHSRIASARNQHRKQKSDSSPKSSYYLTKVSNYVSFDFNIIP